MHFFKKKLKKDENSEIIQQIRSFNNKTNKFDFQPSKKLTGFKLLPSAQDPLGVVIIKGDKIYRGIYPKSKEKFIELYNTGILQILSKEGLFPHFSISDFYTDDYPLMVEVEKLDIIHAQNYTYSMIRKEAILKLRLLEILSEFGYTLIDGHTGNTTFKKGMPIFFDLGSFVKSPRTGWADSEIWQHNIIPLLFLSCGKFMSGRGIYYGIPNPWLIPYINFRESQEVKEAIKVFCHLTKINRHSKLKKKLKKFKPFASTDLDTLFPADNYALTLSEKKNYPYPRNGKNECDNVSVKIVEKIGNLHPNTSILHLGCSTGYFEAECLKQGYFKSVTGLDCNEFLLEYAVNHVKGADFLLCNAVIGGPNRPISADIVYASGIMHSLLIERKLDITFVLMQIRKYVNTFLYIEFFPYGKQKGSNTLPPYYTTEWFEKQLSKFFKILDKEVLETTDFGSELKPSRILYQTKIID